jgi:hypothetical protein
VSFDFFDLCMAVAALVANASRSVCCWARGGRNKKYQNYRKKKMQHDATRRTLLKVYGLHETALGVGYATAEGGYGFCFIGEGGDGVD